MHTIVEKTQLAENVCKFVVKAPHIAAEHCPGQFIILQVDHEWGERIPLTIAASDKTAGTITIIFQTVGNTTRQLGGLSEGDTIPDILGPLGNPTEIIMAGHIVCVGGGIGTAPLHPITKAFKEKGNKLTTILGARSADLLILEDEMASHSDELLVATDDGSKGHKGFVTDLLSRVCAGENKPDMAAVIGPPPMMKACCELTRSYGIQTIVSLNAIMIDGTGMCGGCRINYGGETKFVCIDGPEFDGHKVDFDNLQSRLGSYKSSENADDHACKIGLKHS